MAEDLLSYEKFTQQIQEALKSEDADENDVVAAKNYLSDFQIEKLTKYFYVWFDRDGNGVINHEDFNLLNEKIMAYTGWSANHPYAKLMKELHDNFWNCLRETAHRNDYLHEKDVVTLEDWLNMWGRLTRGALAMRNFPYWLQLLPHIVFLIIDRDGDGCIAKEELRSFYIRFMGIDQHKVGLLTDIAYRRMTGNGDFSLTMDLYEMVFANFLLGTTFAGPGPYIFGIFKTSTEEQPVNISIPEPDPAPKSKRQQYEHALHWRYMKNNNLFNTMAFHKR